MVMLKLAQVTPYQQQKQTTCSAACLRAVLLHHGRDIPEPELEEVIGVGDHGAEVDSIARAARELGFQAEERRFKHLLEAKRYLDQGLPIIGDFRSWNRPGQGHYVVIVGIDDGRAEIMDPNTPGNWRDISAQELKRRWWDWSMARPHKLMRHAGVLVLP
jgi:ABC-type bacteriocin/lantibiotic exporter with double-glycine peptidase domain